MSKFFKGAVSSSDSSDASSSEDEAPVVRRGPTVADFAYPSDSDEDTGKRVVVAQKDRKFGELKDLIRHGKQAKNIKDMSKLLSVFEDLTKAHDKAKTVMARQNVSTPRFYVRFIAELEDFLNEIWEDKDAKKSMSKINAKSLGTLRQKVRKYVTTIENLLKPYRDSPDPVGYSSAEDESKKKADSDADSDDDLSPKKAAAPTKKASKNLDFDSDSEDESDWGSDSSVSSSEEELDFETKKMEDLRKYFLKKEYREDGAGGDDDKKKKRTREQRQKAVELDEDDEDGEGWTEDKVVPLFDPKTEITHEAMIEKLEEVMASRGRKGTDRKQHVRTLQELFKITDEKKLGPGLLVKILFSIVSSLFELNSRVSDFMDFPTWTKTLGAIHSLLALLIETDNVELSIRVTEEEENLKDDSKLYRVQGSILLSVQRLDAELTKILQNADCHSTDYIEKLKGEKDMCVLIDAIQTYVDERVSKNLFTSEEFCKVYMLRIEHTYYKYDEGAEGDVETASKLMEKLCKKIYVLDEDKRLRQRAVLCHVYHLALHDKWHEARDLMLMSHLQAIVDHSDASTQILYNRTICQLGLCAFRHGFIKEAHHGLSEIQNTQRAKELLAQGLAMRQQERTVEQEKVERSRQIPYHMHINIELMECVYLICSMLLEIPHMASHEFEMRRKLLSRSFHYQLKQSEKSSLVGPPENTREHVVAASRAMLAGDWRKCRDFIVNEKMNAKVWNLFRNADTVRTMVMRRVQEESLRTYLLMYSTVYSTVSLEKLSGLFELPKGDVHAIISKMIIQEELSATLDEPTDCLIMHRVEPSRLQLLALNLADKLQNLAENNEQIMEPRTGGRGGYAGPGAWFAGRREGGDDKKRGNYNNAARGEGQRGGQDGNKRSTWGAGGGQKNQQGRRGGEQKRF